MSSEIKFWLSSIRLSPTIKLSIMSSLFFKTQFNKTGNYLYNVKTLLKPFWNIKKKKKQVGLRNNWFSSLNFEIATSHLKLVPPDESEEEELYKDIEFSDWSDGTDFIDDENIKKDENNNSSSDEEFEERELNSETDNEKMDP